MNDLPSGIPLKFLLVRRRNIFTKEIGFIVDLENNWACVTIRLLVPLSETIKYLQKGQSSDRNKSALSLISGSVESDWRTYVHQTYNSGINCTPCHVECDLENYVNISKGMQLTHRGWPFRSRRHTAWPTETYQAQVHKTIINRRTSLLRLLHKVTLLHCMAKLVNLSRECRGICNYEHRYDVSKVSLIQEINIKGLTVYMCWWGESLNCRARRYFSC